MGYSDPTSSRDLLGNRSLCFIFICAFGLVTLLQQILYGKNYIKSGQQFSRLKGEEVGNWSGLISYPDDGGMKPARNGRKRCVRHNFRHSEAQSSVFIRPCIADFKKKKKEKKRYLERSEGSLEYNSTSCKELRQEITDVKVLTMVKTSELFERWRNLQVCKWQQNKEETDNFKMSLSRCCNAPSFLFTTKRNTPSGTKLRPPLLHCPGPPLFQKLEKWRKPFYDVLKNYENSSVVLPAFYNTRNTDVSFRVKYMLDDFESARGVFFFHPQYLLNVQRFWAVQGVRAKRLSSGLMLVTAAMELCEEVHLYGFWAFPMNPSGIFITHHYYDNVKPRPGFHAMPYEIFNFMHMHARGIVHVHTGPCR
ncbi:alpha-2,8-sialyltransferase 8E [Garra rufa]|uniref:alpha-2,8-sialyltransferase 8E n=1 Tax=Garra rufa TaxID=137080 RepID=UPI003CCEA062